MRLPFALLGAALAASALWACADEVAGGTLVDSSRQTRAVVWAVGDGAARGGSASKVVRLIERGRPDRFLYLGDVYEHGLPDEYSQRYAPTYGRFDPITAPTPGNHDWPAREVGYRPYWRRAYDKSVPAYYDFRIAGWHLLSLNSEAPHNKGSKQLRWLAKRLAGGGNCRLAFWHRPRYSAGRHGDQGDMAPVWAALRGRAVLAVSGHDHDMQQMRPIDGITQLVSGAGGRDLYRVDAGDPRLRFSNDSDYGALRIDLAPGTARFAFFASSGKRLHSGAVGCRSGRV